MDKEAGIRIVRQTGRQGGRHTERQENRHILDTDISQIQIQAVIQQEVIQAGNHADRQSYSQAGSNIYKQADLQAGIQVDRQTYIQADRQPTRQSYRQRVTQASSQTYIQTVVQSGRQSQYTKSRNRQYMSATYCNLARQATFCTVQISIVRQWKPE